MENVYGEESISFLDGRRTWSSDTEVRGQRNDTLIFIGTQDSIRVVVEGGG